MWDPQDLGAKGQGRLSHRCSAEKLVMRPEMSVREQRERRRSAGSLLAFLAGMVCSLAGMSARVRGWDPYTILNT